MVHIILRNVYTKHKVHQIAHKYIDIFISVVVLVSLCFYLIWQMLVVMLAMRVSVYMCLLIHLRVCVYMCLSGEAMLCDSNYSSIYVYSIGYVYIKYAYGRPIVIRLKFCSNRFACATQHDAVSHGYIPNTVSDVATVPNGWQRHKMLSHAIRFVLNSRPMRMHWVCLTHINIYIYHKTNGVFDTINR